RDADRERRSADRGSPCVSEKSGSEPIFPAGENRGQTPFSRLEDTAVCRLDIRRSARRAGQPSTTSVDLTSRSRAIGSKRLFPFGGSPEPYFLRALKLSRQQTML